jgi:pyruvate/2-oxoglutarate dehydrogenase complex dihydrolipoamide dehydrogenase (E3) component
MLTMKENIQIFDAIIIGSGQGGTPLARKLAKAGWKTALIEKDQIGGTCINRGCTPTKTLIADAKLVETVRQAPSRGVQVSGLHIEFDKIMARKNEVVHAFRSANEKGLESIPTLTVLHGEARFTGPKTLWVEGAAVSCTAEKIFINAGCAPSIPPIEGLDTIPYLTSTSLLDIKEVPAHLVILGGGDISLEMGQLFRRLGAEVTIIERGAAIVSREDTDVQEALGTVLKGEGIRILTNTEVSKVCTQNGAIQVNIVQEGKPGEIIGSHLLVATGRSPQTRALHTEATGLVLDPHGFIKTDEYLQTNVGGIYAIGDIKGGPAFTHISYNDYVILYKNLLEGAKLSIRDRQVPYCVFTDPQLGRIGLTEKEAQLAGISYTLATLPMTHVARAIETGNTKGFMKALIDTVNKKILGAAILGEEGGELMTILQMAMLGGITYDTIKDMVFAHPLYAESLNNLFLTLDK